MQAVILAGGKGERLRPFTQDRPKAMVEIRGVPLLEYQLRWLRREGVDRAVIACGYRHEVIQEYFGDGARVGVALEYAVEAEPLGRGGGLKHGLGRLQLGPDEPCVATNGDVITDLRLADAVAVHRRAGLPATVVVVPFVSPYGIVEVDGEGRVAGFREKPQLPYWINAGIYILTAQVAPLLPDRGDHEDTTFPQLSAQRRLGAYRARAFWRGVDTVKDLSEVAEAIERGLVLTA